MTCSEFPIRNSWVPTAVRATCRQTGAGARRPRQSGLASAHMAMQPASPRPAHLGHLTAPHLHHTCSTPRLARHVFVRARRAGTIGVGHLQVSVLDAVDAGQLCAAGAAQPWAACTAAAALSTPSAAQRTQPTQHAQRKRTREHVVVVVAQAQRGDGHDLRRQLHTRAVESNRPLSTQKLGSEPLTVPCSHGFVRHPTELPGWQCNTVRDADQITPGGWRRT